MMNVKKVLLLARIATNPEYDYDDLADKIPGCTTNQVRQHVADFRKHGKVVVDPKTGTAEQLMDVLEEYDDIEQDTVRFMLTGKGMSQLKEYEHLLDTLVEHVKYATSHGVVFKPPEDDNGD